jgi:hypothetical protein
MDADKNFQNGEPMKIDFEQKETKETKINKETPGLTAGLKLFTELACFYFSRFHHKGA